MPRKKKEPIIGISSDPKNKLLVQKSNELTTLWRSDMTLAEFKLLDVFLSRINSHDPEHRTVVLSKGQIEEALGVTKLSAKDLSDRLLRIGQGIKVEDLSRKSGFRIVWLLDEAKCELDEYGQWKVTMEASPKAMKYFFNIDTIGYYRYKLHCIAGITSRYTFLMFNYLERNRTRKNWVEDLEELKRLLNCDDVPTYQEFKAFNNLILKRCQAELQEKTECHFTYETIKKGRTVTGIQFTLETLKDIQQSDPDTIPGQITIEDLMQPSESGRQLPDHLQLIDSATGKIFTQEELEAIWQAVANVPESDLPDSPYGIEIRRYHYVAEKVALMNLYDAKKPIKNKLKYLIKMFHEKEDNE